MNTPNSNPSPSVLDPSIGVRRPDNAERRVLLPGCGRERKEKREKREEEVIVRSWLEKLIEWARRE